MAAYETDRLLARCSILSLDVFDTAVVRLVERPTDVFRLVAANFVHERPSVARIDFAAERIAGERRARELARARDGAPDITLDEIYAAIELPPDWPPTRLRELEIEAERRICRRNEAIHALYRAALADDKRVVFVSDMYLPSSVIAEILHDCGYDEFEGLYVSSENKRVKGDGSQYRHVAEQLGVAPHEILHVGDNFEADVRAARAAGCHALHHAPAVEPQRQAAAIAISIEESVRRGLVAQRRRAAAAATGRDDYWRRFGYEICGCLLYGFVEWLRQQLVRDGIDRAYFLSRDGYILQRAYERLRAAGRPGPDGAYLYASRRAFFVPAIDALDDDTLEFLVAGRPGLNVAGFLSRAGLDSGLYVDEVRASGFSHPGAVPRSAVDLERLRTLFRRLESPLLARAAEERVVTTRYLRQLGMLDGGKVAIVDVGWNGSMHKALHRLFAVEGLDVDLRGYYIGTFRAAAALTRRGARLHGWVCQDGQPPHVARLCESGAEIVEFVHLAPHGSVVGYRADGDVVEPVIGPNDADAAKTEAAAELQVGALEFVDDFLAIARDFPGIGISVATALAPIARVIERPTPEEALRLGELPHADGYGPAFVSIPIARPPQLWGMISDPGLLHRTYARSFWKQGFVVRLLSEAAPAQQWVTTDSVLDVARMVIRLSYGIESMREWRRRRHRSVYQFTRDSLYNVAQRHWPESIAVAKRLLGRPV